jgi:hypothetical protein
MLNGAKHNQILPNLAPSLSVRVLQACITTQSSGEAKSLHAYDVGEILDVLEANPSIPRDVLARLEFALLPLFRFEKRQPRTLNNELASNPQFFAELVEMVYKPESGAERNLSEQDVQFAHVARQLLDGWTLIPGSIQDENGTHIKGESLQAWIAAARAETEARDRKTMGLHAIAEMLARSPTGRDGFWPHEAVRDALEELEEEVVPSAFHMSRYNRRGVTSRGMFDGGQQERNLAAWYATQAKALTPRWSRTAAILRDFERTYLGEARYQDLQAEENQDRD